MQETTFPEIDISRERKLTPEQELVLETILSAIHYLKNPDSFPDNNSDRKKKDFREKVVLYFKSNTFAEHCAFVGADPDLILEAMKKAKILK